MTGITKQAASANRVAATRRHRAKHEEPAEITEAEKREIRRHCRQLYRDGGLSEHPYPKSWAIRRDLWTREVLEIVRESLAAILRVPEILEGEFVRELTEVTNKLLPEKLPPAPVAEEECAHV